MTDAGLSEEHFEKVVHYLAEGSWCRSSAPA